MMLGRKRDPLCVAIDVIVVRLGTKKFDIAVGSALELGRWQKGRYQTSQPLGSFSISAEALHRQARRRKGNAIQRVGRTTRGLSLSMLLVAKNCNPRIPKGKKGTTQKTRMTRFRTTE